MQKEDSFGGIELQCSHIRQYWKIQKENCLFLAQLASDSYKSEYVTGSLPWTLPCRKTLYTLLLDTQHQEKVCLYLCVWRPVDSRVLLNHTIMSKKQIVNMARLRQRMITCLYKRGSRWQLWIRAISKHHSQMQRGLELVLCWRCRMSGCVTARRDRSAFNQMSPLTVTLLYLTRTMMAVVSFWVSNHGVRCHKKVWVLMEGLLRCWRGDDLDLRIYHLCTCTSTDSIAGTVTKQVHRTSLPHRSVSFQPLTVTESSFWWTRGSYDDK